MRKYLQYILPTPAMLVATLILPTLLLIYFLATQYGDSFIKTQGIDYVAVQDNILATLFLSGQIGDFITRAMDFVFWGVLASIGLLIFWGVSVARTSIQNNSAVASFINSGNQNWHNHILILIGVKIITIVIMIYSLLLLLTRAIPRLATGSAETLQSIGFESILATLWGFGFVLLVQCVFVVALRTFKLAKFE